MSATVDYSDEIQPDEYESRLTIDLDAKEFSPSAFRLKAIRSWHNLQDMGADVDVHVSSSGKGLHLVAWFREPLRFHEQVAIRREAGDDPRRTWMDCQRWLNGLYTDVLFEDKDRREFSKERRFSTIYDALDFIAEYQRDDYQRVKSLVNDGHRGAPDLVHRQEGEA